MKRRVGLAALLLAAASAAHAGPTREPEPALRALLSEVIDEATSFDDRYTAEVWLVDMSSRMQRYVPNAIPDVAVRLQFLRQVHAEATRARLSPELVLAVIDIESRFDRYAVSYAGAQGYMQIMPFWLNEIGKPGDSLFDRRTNLRMGCTILKFYIDMEKGSYVRGLARYNGSYGKPDYPYLVLNRLNTRWARL